MRSEEGGGRREEGGGRMDEGAVAVRDESTYEPRSEDRRIAGE